MYEDPEAAHGGLHSQLKRKRSPPDHSNGTMRPPISSPISDHTGSAHASGSPATSVTNFRTVSACNRCRTRKNRCDQKLPACTGCEKSGTPCVGFDPVLNREIPRNYVMYLESRVHTLENLLKESGIPYPPATDLAIGAHTTPVDLQSQLAPSQGVVGLAQDGLSNAGPAAQHSKQEDLPIKRERAFTGPDNKASTSAISFASVVREAVRKHITPAARHGPKNVKEQSKENGNHTDSFFGLYAPSNIKSAPFPDAQLARDLSHLYFELANPQIPVLHRGEFARFLDRTYNTDPQSRSPRATFFVNILCAIGSGIIMDKSNEQDQQQSTDEQIKSEHGTSSLLKHAEPEQYYAAAMACLESFNGAPRAMESTPNGLEELQALLLVAYYALLRPVAPGLWYIAGAAMRLAKILGLYHEGPDDATLTALDNNGATNPAAGRLFWVRDMRRRLWYCAYSIDRLVSVCVGRPTSIDDTVITTPFPTLLDDRYLTPEGIFPPVGSPTPYPPTYKRVSYHYFRLRLLQSEILQVLESRRAQLIRSRGSSHLENPYLLRDLEEPFLARFRGDFRRWRADIDGRLHQWQHEAPTQHDTGVKFNPLFFELNFWQTLVMLYRHSLPVPEQLVSELDETALEESKNSRFTDAEDVEDEQMVYQKAGVAGQSVLRIYRELHIKRLVNYTYLATHHIFICGVSFLYSIWQSPLVRQNLQPQDIDLTVLAATTVLTGLIPKCPPAQSARDAFKRMSKVTMAFYLATTRQGVTMYNRSATMSPAPLPTPVSQDDARMGGKARYPQLDMSLSGLGRRPPQFDTNFKSLFSEEEMSLRSPDFPLPKKYLPAFEKTQRKYGQGPPERARPTSHPGLGLSELQRVPHSDVPLDPSLAPGGQMGAVDPVLYGQQMQQQHQQAQGPMSPYAPSLHSAGSDGGHGFEENFWDNFNNDPGSATWAMDNIGSSAGMGFELGFGAGAMPSDGRMASPSWPERGFEMLDGWLLGGTGGMGLGIGSDDGSGGGGHG
ncbi:hypothetical protein ANO11243_077260 [Dothideomycetidae sp. 11243]|nr:hypothetical protein ANO11243_077260 [fungal sp. No.11243]